MTMTNGGDLFCKRTTFRQGNIHQNLHPLNDCINGPPHNLSEMLDNNVELAIAHDHNSALGPNAFVLADTVKNSCFFPSQALAETKSRPNFVFDSKSKAKKMSLHDSSGVHENGSTKTQLEIMRQRRKKRESKQKFNVIESNKIEGHYGEATIDEIMSILEPERTNKTGMEKKKKKKGGSRKNKGIKSGDAKDLDVEVELDKDDVPDDLKELVEKIEESEEQEEQPMEGIEEGETSADVIDDANQNPIGSKSSCDPSEFMDTANTVVESNLEPSEPNNVEEEASVEKPQLTEEESNEQTLERSWNKFMKKYGKSVYTYVDFPTPKTSGRNNAKKRSDHVQKEAKTIIYRNSRKQRN